MALCGVSRRGFLGGATGAAAAVGLARLANAQAAAKPNFVVIFTDDLGHGDLGCYGSPNIATPRLDRMAQEGMRFTDFYCNSPVCTPSRAALLTGCYSARVGMARGVLFPNAKSGLNIGEVTIAKMLKAQGYATACVGKWHLGDAPRFLPTRHGFDSYFGIPYSNDMRISREGKNGPPVMRDEQIVEHPADQATLTERYTEEAIKFITRSKDKPFFLYLPHTMPHVPLFASERFAGKSKRGLYGDVVETIDWSTGQILDTLKNLGLEENTLVVFTSDNGPWLSKGEHGGSAGPLRAGKGTVYEGGMREPAIFRWPGTIPAGKTCSELAATIDMLPTLAALSGARTPADRVIDGRSIVPLLKGEAGAKSPHEAYFFWDAGGALAAVRRGKWKLHVKRSSRDKKGKETVHSTELYDLVADIGEKENLAEKHADLVEQLTKLADAHRQDIVTNGRPVGTLPVDG